MANNATARVRQEIELQVQHMVAFFRLHALRHLTHYDQLGMTTGSLTLQSTTDGTASAKPIVVSKAAFEAACNHLIRVVNLPQHMRERSLLPHQIQLDTPWFHNELKDLNWMAAAMLAWSQAGQEVYWCCDDPEQTNIVSFALPVSTFILKVDRLFGLDSGKGKLVVDTYLVYLRTPQELLILPLPRTPKAKLTLAPEKALAQLWRYCQSPMSGERVSVGIEQRLDSLNTAYLNWLPGMHLRVHGNYDAATSVFTHSGQIDVGAQRLLANKTSDDYRRKVGTRMWHNVARGLIQLSGLTTALEASRTHRQESKPSLGGTLNTQLQKVYRPKELIQIQRTRYQGGDSESSGKSLAIKRKSPAPHPRYLPRRTLVTGKVQPARVVPVKGWDPKIHGYPAGRLTIVRR